MMAGTPAGAGPHMESLSALALEGFDELRAAAETRLTEALQQLTTGGHTGWLQAMRGPRSLSTPRPLPPSWWSWGRMVAAGSHE